jgi:YVTN family beta-propeller protein
VVPIPVGAQPNAITITGRDVWVVNSGDGTVTRINADSNTSTQTIPVGTLPDAIASGPRGIWVGNRGDDTIQYIDPTTGAPRPAISADGPPDGIALDGNTAWVTDTLDGTVSQVDTTTGDVIHGPIHTDAGASGIALTAHDVWVTNSLALSVTRIDRATGQVVGVIRVGDGPSSITAAGKYLWVGDQYDGTITRIDPTRGDDVRNYAIGSSPTGLAAIGDKVWVASGAFTSRSHIGGTLRVVSYFIPGDLGGIDPANVYVPLPLAAQRMVYDGLVSFRQASGQAGWTLVPDLATALPQPTDGGRTYTFTIRPGIRYSDGTTVIASDIRRGVLRELRSTLGNPLVFFDGIRGAATCIAHRQSCDTVLRTGIVVKDPGRITFHLTAPDPNFLYKLTYFAVATAPTAPATPPMVAAPLPATGPYMIKTYRQRKNSENPFQRTSEFTMVRNPYFHQWSFAAQPNGYPKVIDFQHVSSAAAAVKLVQDGAADVTLLPYAFTDQATNAHLVQDLRQRFGPARLHTVTVPDTDYPISLNTHIPPFNSRDARQAVNYTVDRNLLITLSSGPSPGVPSCQMLPPNFPGYRPYCPYTTGPADGPYRGPDLPRAQALIARSDTRDMAVTVWGYAGPNHPTNQYIARVLHQLGYRVTLRELPNNLNTGDAYLSDPAHRVQIAVIGHGWLPDYPSPSTYYDDMASCHDYSNHHMYCNPALDRLAGQATALQATDPAASRALWTHIDKTLTDEAPWVVSNNETWSTFTSSRVRNFQLAPQYNMPVFDQLWVE